MSAAGKLWVVATPIGNLDDLSLRARDVLSSVDVIAAEDTRHSASLLRHFGIATKCVALHEHNEREASGELVRRMQEGASIALISDAGTPLISDPGFRLVRAPPSWRCRSRGCRRTASCSKDFCRRNRWRAKRIWNRCVPNRAR